MAFHSIFHETNLAGVEQSELSQKNNLNSIHVDSDNYHQIPNRGL